MYVYFWRQLARHQYRVLLRENMRVRRERAGGGGGKAANKMNCFVLAYVSAYLAERAMNEYMKKRVYV